MKQGKRFNIHMIQWRVVAGRPEDNLKRAEELLERVNPEEGDLILLPELFSSGFAYPDLEKLASSSGQIVEWMGAVAASRSAAVAGSLPELRGGGVENTMIMVDKKGVRMGSYVKTHLFPLTGEEEAFHAGGAVSVFNWVDISAGLMICFDLRFPELARRICLEGAQIILVSAQWPRARVGHFVDFVRVRAMENQLFVAAANSCGDDGSGLVLGGNSLVAGPMGEIPGQLDDKEGVLSLPVDLGEVERVRREFPVLSRRRPDLY